MPGAHRQHVVDHVEGEAVDEEGQLVGGVEQVVLVQVLCKHPGVAIETTWRGEEGKGSVLGST